MYRLLIILISFLFTAHAVCASVAIPYVFVKNYTVDDYKASCQNWGFSLTPDGMLYVANNSGLLAFDGNTWKLYSLPGQEEVTGVTNYNDTIYTRNETMLGSWTCDKDGILHYHPLNTVPPEVRFTPPPVEIPFTLPIEIQNAQPSAFATNGTLFFIGTLTQGLYITDSDGTILQHLSLQNQLQDNIDPLYLRTGLPANLGGARQRIITNIFRSSDHLVREKKRDRQTGECRTGWQRIVYPDQPRLFQTLIGSRKPFRPRERSRSTALLKDRERTRSDR